MSRCGLIVNVLYFLPSKLNLCLIPAVTNTSHWWGQEGHLAKVAPMHQQSPTYTQPV